MFETYPKGGKTTHKKEKHEESLSGWKGNPSATRYPQSGKAGETGIDTNESKQSARAPYNDGGGNAQVSAKYPQSGGKNGKSFNTDCNY